MKKYFSGKRLYLIMAVFLILGIAVAVHSCASRVKPDLVISYIGENYFSSERFYDNADILSAAVGDINGDGKSTVELTSITFRSNLTASQEQNNYTKITMSMGQGESRLYLMDKAYCMHYAENEILADLSEYAKEGAKVLTAGGKVYAISVEGNKTVEKLGLDDTEEIYVALRSITEMDYVNFKDPSPQQMDMAAHRALEYILNNK